jgi:hypothetical protein
MNNDFQGYWVFVDRFCRNYLDIFFVCCYEQSYWSLRICETYNLFTIPFKNLYSHLQIMLSILLRFESNFKKKYSIGFLKLFKFPRFSLSIIVWCSWLRDEILRVADVSFKINNFGEVFSHHLATRKTKYFKKKINQFQYCKMKLNSYINFVQLTLLNQTIFSKFKLLL